MTDTPHTGAPEPAEELPGDDIDPDIVEAEIVDAEILDPDLNDIDEPHVHIPEDPSEAVPVLISELMAARAVAVEATDNWKRTAAEFDNFRKRSQRNQDDLIGRSSVRVVAQLLPVLDGLDAAMGFDAETDNEQKMLSGLAGTRELLLTTLASEGVEPIDTNGAEFDPALHEAVQIAEGAGTMVVAAEFRRGYTVKGKVLRAALVAVGYGDDQEDVDESE